MQGDTGLPKNPSLNANRHFLHDWGCEADHGPDGLPLEGVLTMIRDETTAPVFSA